jgi:hypothetical protein
MLNCKSHSFPWPIRHWFTKTKKKTRAPSLKAEAGIAMPDLAAQKWHGPMVSCGKCGKDIICQTQNSKTNRKGENVSFLSWG